VPDYDQFWQSEREPGQIPVKEDVLIDNMVLKIFLKYDTDVSGYLEKEEAFVLVNDVLKLRG
jgi:hypothetical protein